MKSSKTRVSPSKGDEDVLEYIKFIGWSQSLDHTSIGSCLLDNLSRVILDQISCPFSSKMMDHLRTRPRVISAMDLLISSHENFSEATQYFAKEVCKSILFRSAVEKIAKHYKMSDKADEILAFIQNMRIQLVEGSYFYGMVGFKDTICIDMGNIAKDFEVDESCRAKLVQTLAHLRMDLALRFFKNDFFAVTPTCNIKSSSSIRAEGGCRFEMYLFGYLGADGSARLASEVILDIQKWQTKKPLSKHIEGYLRRVIRDEDCIGIEERKNWRTEM